jgi:hypothetical protein
LCTTQAIGQPIDRFIPQRFHAVHRGTFKGSADSGDKTFDEHWETSPECAPAEEFPIEASISQVDAGGKLTRLFFAITERKRAEKRLNNLLVREHALRTQAEEATA